MSIFYFRNNRIRKSVQFVNDKKICINKIVVTPLWFSIISRSSIELLTLGWTLTRAKHLRQIIGNLFIQYIQRNAVATFATKQLILLRLYPWRRFDVADMILSSLLIHWIKYHFQVLPFIPSFFFEKSLAVSRMKCECAW